MLVVMYVKLYLHPYMGSLVNRGKSSKLGLKLTQDPLKYTMCLEAELRPGKTQQSGREAHPLGANIGQERTKHFYHRDWVLPWDLKGH